MAGKRPVDPDPVGRIVRDLRAHRLARGLGQAELDLRIGTTEGQVNKWETGKRSPTLRNAEAWSEALGLTLVLRKR